MNAPTEAAQILEKLEALRTELSDLAFDLERRGRSDAADLAIAVAGRLAEVSEASRCGVSQARSFVR